MKNRCECGCGNEIKNNKRFVHGHNNRNIKFSEDHRTKMSNASINKPKSDEARKNMSITKKRMFKEGLLKTPIRAFKKGHVPWIKDKKHSDKSLKKMSISHKGTLIGDLNPSKRPEVREKIRTSKLGDKNPMFGKCGKEHHMFGKIGELSPNFGKHRSEETIKKIKEKRALQILPVKDTTSELKIQNFSTQLQIEYFIHKYMNIEHAYQCDILIPVQEGIIQKTIIECDGDFIHCNPLIYSADFIRYPNYEKITAKEIWERDEIRTKELIEKGFRVIRLWESDIKKMTLEDFKEILLSKINILWEVKK